MSWEKKVGLFDEPEEPNKKWLCLPCGEKYVYLGQIAGMVIKSCEHCHAHDRILFKYDINQLKPV